MKQIPEHILSAVLELSIACKGGKSDGPTAAVFAKYLADLSPEEVGRAVTKWCLSSQFFPTPHELRSMLEAGSGLNAATAWEEACRAVQDVGYYGTPKWSHPAVGRAAVATCGTWPDFCASPSDGLAAKRAKFFQVFDGLAESGHEERIERTAADLRRLSGESGPRRLMDGTGGVL